MQTAVSLAKAGMSWIQLLGMGFIGSIGAMVDSGLGGASKFDMVMAMLQGFGIGVLGFAFVSVIAQLSASVRALAALFGSISSLTGGIVAARDSYEEGKFEQAAFRLLMGIFGCIMGARDYRNALRDCNVSVVVDETPNGGGGRGCVGDEDGSGSCVANVPNPNGRSGGQAHQSTTASIQPSRVGGEMRYEIIYSTPNGNYNCRYADVVEVVDGEIVCIYQVGRANQNGTPVIRESRAIADIMESPDYNGAPIYFLPYNSNSGPIIFDF